MDINSLPTVLPKDVPHMSGAWFISDMWGDLIDAGLSVDLYNRSYGTDLSRRVQCGELFLRVKGYDKSFTRDQAKELLKSLKSGNRA